MPDRKEFHKDVDRRAHHNALEKQRRDCIKRCYDAIRNNVPDLKEKDTPPTKKSILNEVAKYVKSMELQNEALHREIEFLTKDNKLKRKQLRIVKRAKERKDFKKVQEVLKTVNFSDEEESKESSNQKPKEVQEVFQTINFSDEEESDGSENSEGSNEKPITIVIDATDSESESLSSKKENSEADSHVEEVPSSYNQILSMTYL